MKFIRLVDDEYHAMSRLNMVCRLDQINVDGSVCIDAGVCFGQGPTLLIDRLHDCSGVRFFVTVPDGCVRNVRGVSK